MTNFYRKYSSKHKYVVDPGDKYVNIKSIILKSSKDKVTILSSGNPILMIEYCYAMDLGLSST